MGCGASAQAPPSGDPPSGDPPPETPQKAPPQEGKALTKAQKRRIAGTERDASARSGLTAPLPGDSEGGLATQTILEEGDLARTTNPRTPRDESLLKLASSVRSASASIGETLDEAPELSDLKLPDASGDDTIAARPAQRIFRQAGLDVTSKLDLERKKTLTHKLSISSEMFDFSQSDGDDSARSASLMDLRSKSLSSFSRSKSVIAGMPAMRNTLVELGQHVSLAENEDENGWEAMDASEAAAEGAKDGAAVEEAVGGGAAEEPAAEAAEGGPSAESVEGGDGKATGAAGETEAKRRTRRTRLTGRTGRRARGERRRVR